MKKIIFIVLAFFIGLSISSYAQSGEDQKKKQYKSAWNMANKMAKHLKREKWEVVDSRDLERMLANYYLETEPTCGGSKRGLECTINNARRLNIAEKKLLIDAQVMYMQEMRAELVQTIAGKDSLIEDNDVQTLASEVTSRSEKEFNGDLKQALTIYKTNPDGKSMTVRAFFIIDGESGLARLEKMADNLKAETMQ